VGALLEAKAIHPGRSARDHLRWMAAANGIGRPRVDEVLEQVGLADVAGRRSGGFSLGMGQRLGIATALLGDPATLLLDEPVNGLDPEGIQWIRQLLRSLAAEGRSILVSSHLMSEMALTADRLIVVGRGRLIAEGTVEDVVGRSSTGHVQVDAADPERLHRLLHDRGADVSTRPDGALVVTGMNARDIGIVAGTAGITLYELSPHSASLEEAFMELTRDAAEYTTTRGAAA
jgi:ABC-2 type transport system ATP-binding protein